MACPAVLPAEQFSTKGGTGDKNAKWPADRRDFLRGLFLCGSLRRGGRGNAAQLTVALRVFSEGELRGRRDIPPDVGAAPTRAFLL